ncbi:protein translocase subunit SecD [Paenibacillus sp. FSL R7-0273]|uniref:protein translocase subunit SecD n=1 Tax=Paenibacillus sp. FSL R7-0273 TaxID=1536772 RepID=UPI000AA860F7|nr:protein translocase subunit SecD [Paenibacillus sp. FSL R7-0273]
MTINRRRIFAFTATVIILCTIITATIPRVLEEVRLGLDLKGGFEVLYEAQPLEPGGVITPESLRQTAASLEKRVNALGTSEPEIWTEGTNRIRVRLPGVTDEQNIRELLGKPAELTVVGPDGSLELRGDDFVEGETLAVRDELGHPGVLVTLKNPDKLKEMSTRLLNRQIRFELDGELLTDPVVQAVMTNGQMRIVGAFSQKEASELADIINMGALPLKLNEKLNQTIGASLGQEALTQTLRAAAIGSIVVLLFMLVFYRLPGLIASFTLITYGWLLLICFNLVQAVMTLPGIAAFVLGVGMAVDANIITYERIKEELRSGKSLPSALTAGSRHSFRTIMDSNVTALISAICMFSLGSGAIKGFAVTMILSIVLSILTNVYFSQWLLRQLGRSGRLQNSRWYSVKPSGIHAFGAHEAHEVTASHRSFNFTGSRKYFYAFSGVLSVIGIVSLLIQQVNYGVDFRAGTSLDIQLSQSITQPQAESIIREAGFQPAVVTIGGEAADRVSLRFNETFPPDSGNASIIGNALTARIGGTASLEENTVDPDIAREFAKKAGLAVALSCLAILVYVGLRFEKRFAFGAIIALLHDVFVVITIFSIFQLEINLPFIAAMLTIIGYSINDTVVIFDRIRENLKGGIPRDRKQLEHIVNTSINQTLLRSVNTFLCVLFASAAILFWGSESIRLFSLAMTLGLITGVYSSVCIASQMWLSLTLRKLSREERNAIDDADPYRMSALQLEYEDADEPAR